MSKLIIAAIAGMFSVVALAQSTTPSPVPTTKEKQEMVKGATADKGYGPRAADASAEAAKKKDQPKALPDTASKQKAVQSVTAQTAGKAYGTAAAEGSAKAAADKSPRKPKPKPQLQSPEMKEASKP
jgi:hypothetical protein